MPSLCRFLGDHDYEQETAIHSAVNSRWVEAEEVPLEFDWRNENNYTVHAIRNQGGCGSCWSFGTSESLSDRFALFTDGQIDVVFSPQYMVSCWSGKAGRGGYTPIGIAAPSARILFPFRLRL